MNVIHFANTVTMSELYLPHLPMDGWMRRCFPRFCVYGFANAKAQRGCAATSGADKELVRRLCGDLEFVDPEQLGALVNAAGSMG